MCRKGLTKQTNQSGNKRFHNPEEADKENDCLTEFLPVLLAHE